MDIKGKASPLQGEVVHLEGLKSFDAYNIISAFIAGNKARSQVQEYLNSAAEMVHALALGIESQNPQWLPSEVLKEFDLQFWGGVNRHIKEGNLNDDWEKKQKPLNQAYRKVKGCLEFGGSLAVYSTCSKCEKFVAQKNEEKVKAAKKQETMDQAAKIAARDKITLEEAIKRLEAPQPDLTLVDNGNGILIQGLSEKDQSLIKELMDDLILISEKDKTAKDRIIQSLQSKVSTAKRDLGLLGPMIKAG